MLTGTSYRVTQGIFSFPVTVSYLSSDWADWVSTGIPNLFQGPPNPFGYGGFARVGAGGERRRRQLHNEPCELSHAALVTCSSKSPLVRVCCKEQRDIEADELAQAEKPELSSTPGGQTETDMRKNTPNNSGKR